MPSQAEIEQQRQDIQELSAVAAAEVAAVYMALSGEDNPDQSLLEAIPDVWRQFMSLAADLAVDWYRGLARTEPATAPAAKPGAPPPIVGPSSRVALLDAADYEPRPAELPPQEQLEATVRWALHQPDPVAAEPVPSQPAPDEIPPSEPPPDAAPAPEEPPQPNELDDHNEQARVIPAEQTSSRAEIIPADATDEQAQVISRLAGATQRYVATAARDTITENAAAEDIRWARHAQPDACAFCRLLATRGPDYLTEESAATVGASGRARGSRAKGESYHDDCACVPVPVRAGDAYEAPDYVEGWVAQYDRAYELGRGQYKRILAEMRAVEKADGGSAH